MLGQLPLLRRLPSGVIPALLQPLHYRVPLELKVCQGDRLSELARCTGVRQEFGHVRTHHTYETCEQASPKW